MMNTASYTVNQFSLVDEKNAALKDLLTEFSWQEEALLQLSLPLLAMVESVSSLEDAAALENFRANVITELKSIKQRGRERTVSPALLDKLCFVWAAFFDERVSYGCHLDTTQWQNKTLVSQLFGIRNSGDTFFNLVFQLMEFPKKHLALLKICYLILQLGFKGKYHSGQATELKKLTAEISFALTELGAFKLSVEAPALPVQKLGRNIGLFSGISPLSFWFTFMALMITGLLIYNQYFGEIYAQQNQEYQEMAGDTFLHIQQLQPKKMFIENARFYDGRQIQQLDTTAPSDPSLQQSQPQVALEDSQSDLMMTSEAATRYLVQIGAFKNMARAQKLKQQCDNARYPLVIEEVGQSQFVGFIANGFTQAKEVSQFFAESCNISPYIKEYQ